MRKLQYVFMALAVLCFAVPAFADSGSAVVSLVPIGAGLGMGSGRRPLRPGSGQGGRFGLSKQWPATPGRALQSLPS